MSEQTNEEKGNIKFTELYRANGVYLLAHSRYKELSKYFLIINKYLLKVYYMPDIILRVGKKRMNKIDNALALIKLTVY